MSDYSFLGIKSERGEREKVNSVEECSHTRERHSLKNRKNYSALFSELKIELSFLLPVDEVGQLKVLKER